MTDGPIQAIAVSEDSRTVWMADQNGTILSWDRAKKANAGVPLRTELKDISSIQIVGKDVLFVRGKDRQAIVVEAWLVSGARLWRRTGRGWGNGAKVQVVDGMFWVGTGADVHVISRSGTEVGRMSNWKGDRVLTIAPDGRFSMTGDGFENVVAVSSPDGTPRSIERVLEKLDPNLDLFESNLARGWRLVRVNYLAPTVNAAMAQPLLLQGIEALIGLWMIFLVLWPGQLCRLHLSKADGSPPFLAFLTRFEVLETPFLKIPFDLVCSNIRCRTAYLREARQEICLRQRDIFDPGPYVDLGQEKELEELCKQFERRDRRWLWLTAPGGRGKSTLAKRIAELLASSDGTVVPVFVDHDWLLQTSDVAASRSALLDTVAHRLSFKSYIPTQTMVSQWLHDGSVVLLIDGASEKKIRSDEGFFVDFENFSRSRSLVVTARSRPPQKVSFQIMEPNALSVLTAGSFCAAHLSPSHPLLAEAEKAVVELIAKYTITPLFARLYLTQVALGVVPPLDAPAGIVRDYIENICKETRLRPDHFRWGAQLAATTMTDWETFTPVPVRRERLLGALAGSVNATYFRATSGAEVEVNAVLDELVDSGLLAVISQDQIRFREDPVAEYLSASWLILQGQKYTDDKLKKFSKRDQRRKEHLKGLLAQLGGTSAP